MCVRERCRTGAGHLFPLHQSLILDPERAWRGGVKIITLVPQKFHHLHHFQCWRSSLHLICVVCITQYVPFLIAERERYRLTLLLLPKIITFSLLPQHFSIFLLFQPPSWEDDTDEFLKSMLTGSDLSSLGVSASEAVCPSDTSSDSGCPEEQVK